MVYVEDHDAEELTDEQLYALRRETPLIRGSRPKHFTRDTWAVPVANTPPSTKTNWCIVSRIVGGCVPLQYVCEDTLCSSARAILNDNPLGTRGGANDGEEECMHIKAVRDCGGGDGGWDGTSLFYPPVVSLGGDDGHGSGLARVYQVIVLRGEQNGCVPIIAQRCMDPCTFPIDLGAAFKLVLAVLSDFHGAFSIVTGGMIFLLCCGE